MTFYVNPSPATLLWVASQCAAEVVTTERLLGGITACMDLVVLRAGDGAARHVVLRRWENPGSWTDGMIEREAAALCAMEGQGVPAPHLLATDPTGDAAGVRALLMTEQPGKVELAPADPEPWLAQLADTQARIHAVAQTLPTTNNGWFDPESDFGWIDDHGLRRAALAAADAPASAAPPVLVHGDYQHFNVLWTGPQLSGIVDWTMAGIGPRGTDVGHCRLNLAVLYSADTADAYLRHYERAADVAVDATADLRALLCWGPDWKNFIPTQVAGRAPVDLDGMADRVVETIRRTVARLG